MAQKPIFHTSERASNLGGHSGDLSEHRGSGNVNLGITSQNGLFYALFSWPRRGKSDREKMREGDGGEKKVEVGSCAT